MKNPQTSFRTSFLRCLTVLFCAVFVSLSPHLIQAQNIEWKVKDPFRLIDYSEPGTEHWRIPSKKSASDFVVELMKGADRANLPPYKSTFYKRDRGPEDTTVFDREYVFPQKVRVKAWLTRKQEGDCSWQYLGEQTEGGKFKCDEPFEFDAVTHLFEADAGAPNTPNQFFLTVSKDSTRSVIGTARIVVKDRLVLSLGDSFASGEGNPDKPSEADPEKLRRLADTNKGGKTNGRWMGHTYEGAERNWLRSKANWLDRQCHRSLFGQHVLTAMRLATRNPHESVTLLPLACSGAEVLDGLLTPQIKPPGGGERVADSQVNLAIKHLCSSIKTKKFDAVFYRGSSGDEKLTPIEQELLRCEGDVREPDAILLSIGGNDIGFAPAIAWAAIPFKGRLGRLVTGKVETEFPLVCPSESTGERCGKFFPPAKYRITNWLPIYYRYLMDELTGSGLVTDSKKIFLTSYPDPTYKKGGIEVCDETASEDSLEQIRTLLPWITRPRSWDLWFTKEEIVDLRNNMIQPLANAMQESAKKHKWTFVNDYLEEIRKDHGLCADYSRGSDGRPMYSHIDGGTWYPKSPDLEWAYDTKRQRWFRNTNDSILFQYEADEKSLNGSIKGSFHPDFRAHALMADEVFNAVMKNWNDAPAAQR